MLTFNIAVLALSAAQLAVANDYEILGSVIFGRHNDREEKPATVLTPIGAQNQFLTGQFYRERYFGIDSAGDRDSSSDTRIKGLNDEGMFVNGQFYGEAPASNVILYSHYAFLQGLFPPTVIQDTNMVDDMMAELANGSVLNNPLNGYQYVKSNIQENATDGYIHIKGDENCPALTKALHTVQDSNLWARNANESAEFLQSLYQYSFIQETFTKSQLTFTNAMNIFDEVYVNSIHNATVAKEINEGVLAQIKVWSDLYQWTLSDKTINSNLTIGAQSLISNILTRLNTTKTTGEPFLHYYTGAFNTMFQLASVLNLNVQNSTFKTMPDYGSTYVFELLSDESDDIFVRFSFKNGTSEMGDEFTSYPMFNSTDDVMSWNDFVSNVENTGISGTGSWCGACGYDDASTSSVLDMCVPYTGLYETAKKLDAEGIDLETVDAESKASLSLVDAGAIGAGVTIAVFMFLSGALYFYMRSRNQKTPITKEIEPSTYSANSTLASVV